jgi:hypothetical protein
MKTVRTYAANVKPNDIYNGRVIHHVLFGTSRKGSRSAATFIYRHAKNQNWELEEVDANEIVSVKRPPKNFEPPKAEQKKKQKAEKLANQLTKTFLEVM